MHGVGCVIHGRTNGRWTISRNTVNSIIMITGYAVAWFSFIWCASLNCLTNFSPSETVLQKWIGQLGQSLSFIVVYANWRAEEYEFQWANKWKTGKSQVVGKLYPKTKLSNFLMISCYIRFWISTDHCMKSTHIIGMQLRKEKRKMTKLSTFCVNVNPSNLMKFRLHFDGFFFFM